MVSGWQVFQRGLANAHHLIFTTTVKTTK